MGKSIDMAALHTKNERVRAVSNVKNLKMDYLEEFVDRRNHNFKKIATKELNMVSILTAIAEIAN